MPKSTLITANGRELEQVINAFDALNKSVGAIPPLMTTAMGLLPAFNRNYGITQIKNNDTGKLDIQGNMLGIDFTAIKQQKQHFTEAQTAITAWNNAVKTGAKDITLFDNKTVQNSAHLQEYLSATTSGTASIDGYKASLNAAGITTDALRIKTMLLNAAIGLGIGIS